MKRGKILLVLALILFLALVLRIFSLTNMPPSLNWDEISHGYNAYSLLKTGSDEWGQRFPVANFRAYGDYPLPLNLYLTAPFVSVLGLSVFAIRLPHALLGVLTVGATYFLVLGLTRKKDLALLASFLVSVNPWYLFTSRFVLQSNLSVFLLISSLAFFFNRERSKWFLPLSSLLLGLTLFSYHSTRIFSPLLLIAMILIYRKALLSKVNVSVLLVFFLPLPFILLNPTARARSSEVFLLNSGVVSQIESKRNESALPEVVKRLVYNRPVYLVETTARNYLNYFSPQFLFINGGTQYQFSVPNQGLLYLVELPFFYIGLLFLVHRAVVMKDKNFMFLAAWLLLAPIPASITTEQFAVVRATTMLPLPEILVSLGFYEVSTWIQKKFKARAWVLLTGFVLIVVALLARYLFIYFTSYKADYSWVWQYGYKEAIEFVKVHYGEYDKIIMTKKYGEPHEYVLFFNSWNPAKYKLDPNLVRFTQSNWWWVDGFDKYMFVNDWQIPKNGNVFITESKHVTDCTALKCLLITSPENAHKNWRKLNSIYFLDGKPAFEIYENK